MGATLDCNIIRTALDDVFSEIITLSEGENIKNILGENNSKKFKDMVEELNQEVSYNAPKEKFGYPSIQREKSRAKIMVTEIDKMILAVEEMGQQADKSKVRRVTNFLKASLKVVLTLGMNKSAKVKLSSTIFALNNKNIDKIKEIVKSTSSTLKDSKLKVKNQKKLVSTARKHYRNTRRNSPQR